MKKLWATAILIIGLMVMAPSNVWAALTPEQEIWIEIEFPYTQNYVNQKSWLKKGVIIKDSVGIELYHTTSLEPVIIRGDWIYNKDFVVVENCNGNWVVGLVPKEDVISLIPKITLNRPIIGPRIATRK